MKSTYEVVWLSWGIHIERCISSIYFQKNNLHCVQFTLQQIDWIGEWDIRSVHCFYLWICWWKIQTISLENRDSNFDWSNLNFNISFTSDWVSIPNVCTLLCQVVDNYYSFHRKSKILFVYKVCISLLYSIQFQTFLLLLFIRKFHWFDIVNMPSSIAVINKFYGIFRRKTLCHSFISIT